MFIVNFSNCEYTNYKLGSEKGEYEEVFSTNLERFGGTGKTNGTVKATRGSMHSRPYHLNLYLAPLSASFFKSKTRKITI